MSSYELKEEFVEVVYAKGPPCGKTLVDIWAVPRDTVVSIRVVPKNKLQVSEVLGDRSSCVKTTAPNDTEISFYTDEKSGIRYTAHSGEPIPEEYVVSIDYLPRLSDNSRKCGSPSRPDTGNQSIPTFDRYGDISSSMEKAILDSFAIQLLRNKELRGYILVYVDRGAKTAQAQRRIRYIKKYLINVRGVPAKRIIPKEGGRREKAGVELYLVPQGKPGPNVERKSSSAS